MSKQLGQNFLVDPNSRQKILDCLSIEQNDRLWEIGPGIGAMTHMLVPKVEE
ncbi:MAG: rRNA adenine N-6-methyltransferase family protein, partial [Spirochaetia bacterium]